MTARKRGVGGWIKKRSTTSKAYVYNHCIWSKKSRAGRWVLGAFFQIHTISTRLEIRTVYAGRGGFPNWGFRQAQFITVFCRVTHASRSRCTVLRVISRKKRRVVPVNLPAYQLPNAHPTPLSPINPAGHEEGSWLGWVPVATEDSEGVITLWMRRIDGVCHVIGWTFSRGRM